MGGGLLTAGCSSQCEAQIMVTQSLGLLCPELDVSEEPLSNKYELGAVVGIGSFGTAFLATRLADGEKVVVKQIKLAELDDRGRQEALQEVRVLAQLDHVNIIHYIECVIEVRGGGRREAGGGGGRTTGSLP